MRRGLWFVLRQQGPYGAGRLVQLKVDMVIAYGLLSLLHATK
jgi:hypothetical protein